MTTKLRVVYDALAKTTGPSLNDCLFTGPDFGQSILDILLSFRVHRIALAGDIHVEKGIFDGLSQARGSKLSEVPLGPRHCC